MNIGWTPGQVWIIQQDWRKYYGFSMEYIYMGDIGIYLYRLNWSIRLDMNWSWMGQWNGLNIPFPSISFMGIFQWTLTLTDDPWARSTSVDSTVGTMDPALATGPCVTRSRRAWVARPVFSDARRMSYCQTLRAPWLAGFFWAPWFGSYHQDVVVGLDIGPFITLGFSLRCWASSPGGLVPWQRL